MSKFADFWKKSNAYEKARDFEVPQEEEVNICVEYTDHNNGIQYRFFNNITQLEEWKLEMGTEVKNIKIVSEVSKSVVEKPAKFDRCVQHVKENNPGANAYAVCNAVMNDKSIAEKSSEYINGLVDRSLKDMGIAGAGPIPSSLLASQDLEGHAKTTKNTMYEVEDSRHPEEYIHESKNRGFSDIKSLALRIKANQRVKTKGKGTFKDLWAKVRVTNKL